MTEEELTAIEGRWTFRGCTCGACTPTEPNQIIPALVGEVRRLRAIADSSGAGFRAATTLHKRAKRHRKALVDE